MLLQSKQYTTLLQANNDMQLYRGMFDFWKKPKSVDLEQLKAKARQEEERIQERKAEKANPTILNKMKGLVTPSTEKLEKRLIETNAQIHDKEIRRKEVLQALQSGVTSGIESTRGVSKLERKVKGNTISIAEHSNRLEKLETLIKDLLSQVNDFNMHGRPTRVLSKPTLSKPTKPGYLDHDISPGTNLNLQTPLMPQNLAPAQVI